MLKYDKNVKGIKIGNTEYKVSQFADNMTVFFLDGSKQAFEATINILSIFAVMSGLKINKSKTRAIWIGCKKFSGETFNHR